MEQDKKYTPQLLLWQPEEGLPKFPITSFAEVGTFGNGLFLVGPDGQVMAHLTESNGLVNGTILSIGGNGQRVWLATLGGVLVSDDRLGLRIRDFTKQPELDRNNVYKVFADHRGRIWFSTEHDGLFCLDSADFQQHQTGGHERRRLFLHQRQTHLPGKPKFR